MMTAIEPDRRGRAGLRPSDRYRALSGGAGIALAGLADPKDTAILATVMGIAVAAALFVFPRRDLAAPS